MLTIVADPRSGDAGRLPQLRGRAPWIAAAELTVADPPRRSRPRSVETAHVRHHPRTLMQARRR